jgi:hypothetical protein
MNVKELQSRLLAAARKNPPGAEVPYAFEKRIMAHITTALAPPDALTLWARALWRAAASCVAVTLLLSFWSLASLQQSDPPEALLQAFESSVFAGMPQHIEDSW